MGHCRAAVNGLRLFAYLSSDMAVRLRTDVETETMAMKLLMVQ